MRQRPSVRHMGAETRRRVGAAGLGVACVLGLVACSGGDEGPPTLTWYINPDSGGQAEIANRCTEAAEGRYDIQTALLPRDSPSQREQLVRRLSSNDSSIDLMSLDPPYIPEFAEAGFLADIPDDVEQRISEDVVESALQGSTWRDELVAAPFWANTQLLWYQKSVAEEAGLDMEQPVTWEQIISAAEETGTQVAAQGIRSESLTVWVNALIESAGGSIIEDPSVEDPESIQLGLDSGPAEQAATVMQQLAESGVGGPAFSTANEDANVAAFEAEDASFMVNWPFVWPRATGGVEGGTLEQSVVDDYGWTLYPQVVEGEPSAPPYGGINIGIGAFSEQPDFAFEAVECITSTENQAYYFITNGNPAARASVYDDPEVVDAFPMAPEIRESLDMAAPRPQTAYYSEVSGGLQREFHPPSSVQPGQTGLDAAELIEAVLAKDQLL